MKVRDVVEKLQNAGWQLARQESSHRTYKKEGETNLVTVSGNDRDELTPGQLSDIRRKSGLPLR